MGEKTTANLKIMRADIIEKLRDVNETWSDMANTNNGNKITRSALSRAVRGAAKKKDHSMRLIDEFIADKVAWQKERSGGERNS